MKHRVASSVSHSAASVGLTSLSVLSGLTSESSLVDLSLWSSGEWHTVRLELTDSNWSLSGHVLDGILISKPVTSFDSVIEVISPVILVHVSKSSIDSSLNMITGHRQNIYFSHLPGQRQYGIWLGRAWRYKQS